MTNQVIHVIPLRTKLHAQQFFELRVLLGVVLDGFSFVPALNHLRSLMFSQFMVTYGILYRVLPQSNHAVLLGCCWCRFAWKVEFDK